MRKRETNSSMVKEPILKCDSGFSGGLDNIRIKAILEQLPKDFKKDYLDYLSILNMKTLVEMKNHLPFWLWTEFHAKYKGYMFLLMMIKKLVVLVKIQIML